MKITKLTLILVVAILAVTALATTVSAYTSANLENYLLQTHVIGGSQFELRDGAKADVKAWFKKHQLTDEVAGQIHDKLEAAKAKVGTSNLDSLSDKTKAEVVSLLQEAGNLAGVTVKVDTSAKTVTISDDGTVVLSGSYTADGANGLTFRSSAGGAAVGGAGAAAGAGAGASSSVNSLVYTGNTSTIFAVVAVLAVVAVATLVVKKVNA